MGIAGSIEGIISGFNTTEIIEAIMQYERRQVDLYVQKQTNQTNRLTTWNSIEAMLTSVKIQAGYLSDENLWYAKTAASSNEDEITVSSTNDAAPGTYFLTVDQLATHHQIASQGIGSLTDNMGAGTIEISTGSSSPTIITIDSSNNTLSALKDAINNSNANATAAIINDGSEHNPYRLVLTAKDSGAASEITFVSNLEGGTAPDFSPGFDRTELLSWDGLATSNPFVTSDASYTGNVNKTYTLTIGGTGAQTIGDGDITVNWTDGTNSGSITVSEAGTDIALTGAGADGLSIYFSAGDLVAGDTFQVQAFAPTIQNGQDAVVQLGSSDGGGSPISFNSSSNTITTLIEGVTIDLHSVSDGDPVEISISEDRSQIKEYLNSFVDKFNEYQELVNDQFSFDPGVGKAGVLLGDNSLMILYNDIRSTITRVLDGRPDDMKMLSQAGITFDSRGRLSFDESVFDEKVEDNFEDLVNLFKSNGTTNTTYVEYVSSTGATRISTTGYEIDITQAASKGTLTGTSITDPATTPLTLDSTNNVLKFEINNIISSDIVLTEKTYNSGDELAEEIENAINSDSNLAGSGIEVEWVNNGTTGNLVIYSSTYGSSSTVTLDVDPDNSAHSILGLSNGVSETGLDVEGTINGESATGNGQYLTGDSDNESTAGLKLLVTFTADDLVEGAEDVITFNKGIASTLTEKITSYIDPYDGIIGRKKDTIESQIDIISDQIESLEELLERKRASLYRQFVAMEQALGQLQAQQEYLTSIISGLNRNWVLFSKSG